MILKKRTLDFHCLDSNDPLIWLAGISASLDGFFLKPKIPITIYSPGRALWKRMLLKLQFIYRRSIKKNRYHKNSNAYAIILFGKDKMQVNHTNSKIFKD